MKKYFIMNLIACIFALIFPCCSRLEIMVFNVFEHLMIRNKRLYFTMNFDRFSLFFFLHFLTEARICLRCCGGQLCSCATLQSYLTCRRARVNKPLVPPLLDIFRIY